jgi:hypothetical protein
MYEDEYIRFHRLTIIKKFQRTAGKVDKIVVFTDAPQNKAIESSQAGRQAGSTVVVVFSRQSSSASNKTYPQYPLKQTALLLIHNRFLRDIRRSVILKWHADVSVVPL